MIDKDLKEYKSLTKYFDNTRVLNCQFHVMQTFKKHFKNKQVFEKLQSLVTVKTKKEFDELQLQLDCLLCDNDTLKKYFDNNWRNCTEMWAFAFREGLPLFNNNTNNNVETLNSKIKKYITRKTTMSNCIENLLKFSNFLYKKHQSKTLVQLSKRTIVQSCHQDFNINLIYSSVTNYAAQILMNQYKLAQASKYKIIEENEMFRLVSSRNEVLVDNFSRCNCYDFKMYRLPCRHIMYVRIKHDKPIFEQSIVDKRWLNSNSIQDKEPSNSISAVTNFCMLNPNRLHFCLIMLSQFFINIIFN
jgi:hypothetical protein